MENKKTLDLEPVITGLCYRKTETLTETEIRQAITTAMLNFGVEYVTTLPTGDNIKQKVYILPDTSGTAGNFGDIYIYDRTNTKWIHIDALKFNINDYLLIADIIDNLTSTNANKALSANQGKVLKALVDSKSASTHEHGNISNTGTLNSDISTVNKVVVTDSNNNVKTINKLPSDKVTHQDISGKVNVSDIKDNLTSTDVNKPLSAKQGKDLKTLIDSKSDNGHNHTKSEITDLTIPTKTSDLVNDNNFISEEWGTFTELKTLIDNASDGDTIVLDKNYRNTDNLNEKISIEKKIHINGNGHIIDFNLSSAEPYFDLSSNQSGISNCTFINNQKSLILRLRADSFISNCIFENNSFLITSASPGAIIEDCIFYNNKAPIEIGSNSYINNCLFFKNKDTCLRIRNQGNTLVTINNCIFMYNTTQSGCIFIPTYTNNNIISCVFKDNTAPDGYFGGAISASVDESYSPNLVNNKFLTSTDTVYPTTLINNEYAIGEIPTKTSELTNDSGFVLTDDSRLSDARTPTSHTHGNITNDGKITATSTAALFPITADAQGNLYKNTFIYNYVVKEEEALSNLNTESNASQRNINTAIDTKIGEINTSLTNKANLVHTHSYNNLDDKPTIPTKTSDLTNDSGYLTNHQDISGKEDISNKVTTISSSSTNTQYPSAKAVYDELPKTTKTLTVTYTNGTTEDIEFYIR